jgi:hypothetical protein
MERAAVAAERLWGWASPSVPRAATGGQCRRGPGRGGYGAAVERPLEIAACRSLCSWDDTGRRLGGEPLFACSGCGSEWVPTQPWTPVDYAGSVPEAVAAARRRRGTG